MICTPRCSLRQKAPPTNKGDAYMSEYYLTDGNGTYIKRNEFSGKISEVRNFSIASSWPSYSKALQMKKNCLNKKQRARFIVKEFVNGVISDETTVEHPQKVAENNANETPVSSPKSTGFDAIMDIVKEPVTDDYVDEAQNILSAFASYIDRMRGEKEALAAEHSKVEREIVDLQHYIEFHELNAYQGWLVFKALQQRLRKRRSIKNSIQTISNIETCNIDTGEIKRAASSVGGLKGRAYTPRELSSIFQ